MAAAVIQLAIGIIFVFLLVGSACSFLNEVAAAVVDRRAAHLERWLGKILGRQDADDFLRHPLIRALCRPRSRKQVAVEQERGTNSPPDGGSSPPDGGREATGIGLQMKQRRVPSYLSPATFATTLLSILAGTEKLRTPASPPTGGGALSAGDVEQGIDLLADEDLRAVLRTLLADAGGELEQFRGRLEGWFGQEMDRLSGWYKRRTKWFLFFWGLGLAIILNLDAVLIVRTLWNDNTLRSAVVAQAEQAVSTTPTTGSDASAPATTLPCPISSDGVQAGATATTVPDPLECVAARIDQLQSLQLPIGWPGWPFAAAVYRGDDRRAPHSQGDWVLKAFGLLVIAGAATQGGPFWFDLLGKVVNLRMTGPPPPQPPQSA
jgi:hypothetical protein